MTGLVAAHRLSAEADTQVDVYERWPGLGGQVATLDVGDGHLLERYYHHLFTSDVHIAGLYRELGMEDAIEWLPSSVAMFTGGHSLPFSTPADLLRFTPLPVVSRLRMGLAVLLLQRQRDVAPFERQTAHDWILRQMGRAAWDKVWGPLLRGKFGDRAEEISMAWLWKRLTVRRQVKGGEARGEVLGYPRGGWQPLLDRLQEGIEARGGHILIDRPAARLSRGADGFDLSWGQADSFRSGHDPRRFEAGGDQRYDRVLATAPNDVFANLLDERLASRLSPDYRRRLKSIEYHEALCLLLELDRRFSPFYWTNIADPEVPFIGLIEQTNLLDPEHYGGRHFLYVANYLEHGNRLLTLDPDELLAAYTPGLRRVNPAWTEDWVHRSWLFREPSAQPVVTLGYPDRMPPLRTGVPGLILANTTQVYPEDRGTNYAVRLGEEAAEALLGGGR